MYCSPRASIRMLAALLSILVTNTTAVSPIRAQADIGVGERAFVEVSAITLPADIDPIGVTGSIDGRLALWTDSEIFVSVDGARVEPLGVVVDRPLAVAPLEGGWQIIDRGDSTIKSVFADPYQFDIKTIPVLGRAAAAAKLRCGWVLQLWNAEDRAASLVMVNEAGRIQWSVDIPWALKPERFPDQVVTLTAGSRAVVITARHYPFAMASIGCKGVLEMFPSDPQFRHEEQWIAVATTPTAAGYLTTYGDLTSNERIIWRRDLQRRQFLRSTRLNVPFAFVAPIGTGSAVAVRRTDRIEIVVYSLEAARASFHGGLPVEERR